MTASITRSATEASFDTLSGRVDPGPNERSGHSLYFGAITASAMLGLSRVVQAKCGSSDAVFAQVGVSRRTADSDSSALSLRSFTAVLEAAATEVGSTTFGLDFGDAFDLHDLGHIGDFLYCAKTLGDALNKFCYYFPVIQDNTKISLEVVNGFACVSYAIEDPTVHQHRQDANFTISSIHKYIQHVLGNRFRGGFVHFRHEPEGDLINYQRYFNCPIYFSQKRNAIFFPAELLYSPISTADYAVCYRIESILSDKLANKTARINFREGIEAWIIEAFCRCAPVNIEDLARELGMISRTLQRKLDACGVSFIELRNNVRLQLAKQMLAETWLPVTSIAFNLGYSEASAFSRAFKNMVGQSPLSYRKRNVSDHSRQVITDSR